MTESNARRSPLTATLRQNFTGRSRSSRRRKAVSLMTSTTAPLSTRARPSRSRAHTMKGCHGGGAQERSVLCRTTRSREPVARAAFGSPPSMPNEATCCPAGSPNVQAWPRSGAVTGQPSESVARGNRMVRALAEAKASTPSGKAGRGGCAHADNRRALQRNVARIGHPVAVLYLALARSWTHSDRGASSMLPG